VPDVDDVRGATLAGLNAVGMAATIVGVPLVLARRLVQRRSMLVLPTAVVIGTGLTIATRRTGWSLVKLWLGIDRRSRDAGTRSARRSRLRR
jgi:hypothetical protein